MCTMWNTVDWHSTLRTLTWGSFSPDAMFDRHLHSSCSTAVIMTFLLAGVCIVCGPPAFVGVLGFTLLAIERCSCNCHLQDNVTCLPTNQYWLDCWWQWCLRTCSSIYHLITTEPCYALHVLGTPNIRANNAAEKCVCSFVSTVCVKTWLLKAYVV
jgi:hypothetical protein